MTTPLEKLNNVLSDGKQILDGILSATDDFVLLVDMNGLIVQSSPSVCHKLEISPTEINGKNSYSYLKAQDLPASAESFHHDLLHIQEIDGWFVDHREQHIPVVITANPLRNQKEETVGIIIFAKPLQKEVKLKTRLLRSKQNRSIGEMAAGVAHEINNPLAIIKGYTEELSYQITSDSAVPPDALKILGIIIETCDRISHVVTSLRMLSRDGSKDGMRLTTVREILDESLVLCNQKFIQAGIAFELKMENPEEKLACQKSQIAKVILNLLINSFTALTQTEKTNDKWIRIETSLKDNIVEFSVIDSGKGISPSIQDRLFQPFFTTNTELSNAGLGLSISRSICDKNGGALYFDSANPNTRFVLELPVYNDSKESKNERN